MNRCHTYRSLDDIEPDITASCSASISHIQKIKACWELTREKWDIPTAWILPPHPPRVYGQMKRFDRMLQKAFEGVLQDIGERVQPITLECLLARQEDLSSVEPDFLLHLPPSAGEDSRMHTIENSLVNDPLWCLTHFNQMTTYTGDDEDIEGAIVGVLSMTPGMAVRKSPNINFRNVVASTSSPDFALLLNRTARSHYESTWFQADDLHPAFILGKRAASSYSGGPPHSHSQIIFDSNDDLIDLARLAQPHLDAHVSNWRVLCERNPDNHRPHLPPGLVLFGLLYHGDMNGHLSIVAHIPYLDHATQPPDAASPSWSFVSCVVDTIPLLGIASDAEEHSSSPESPYLANFRAAIALLTLKRHAFVSADAWEKAMHSELIEDAIADDEHINFGSIPAVSDQGSEDPYLVFEHDDDDEECEVKRIEVEGPEEEVEYQDEHTRERVSVWIEGLCLNEDLLEPDSTLSNDRNLSLGLYQSEASNLKLLEEAIVAWPQPPPLERPSAHDIIVQI